MAKAYIVIKETQVYIDYPSDDYDVVKVFNSESKAIEYMKTMVESSEEIMERRYYFSREDEQDDYTIVGYRYISYDVE